MGKNNFKNGLNFQSIFIYWNTCRIFSRFSKMYGDFSSLYLFTEMPGNQGCFFAANNFS
jgi:hypothetical protein